MIVDRLSNRPNPCTTRVDVLAAKNDSLADACQLEFARKNLIYLALFEWKNAATVERVLDDRLRLSILQVK